MSGARPASGIPARRYSWPPFESGHELSTKHGAWSERKVAPIAEQLAAELHAAAPWTTVPAFALAVSAWAWSEAQARRVRAWLDEHGVLDDDGNPRPALVALRQFENAADRQRTALGLSPAAWAALHRTMTASPDGGSDGIEALRATGRRMIEATTAELERAGDDG